VASSLIDVAGARTSIRPVDGLPMLHVEHPRLAGGGRILKEVVDRLAAALLLVAGAPFVAVIALAVGWTTPGPVLFRQVRVGKMGVSLSSTSSAPCSPTLRSGWRRSGT